MSVRKALAIIEDIEGRIKTKSGKEAGEMSNDKIRKELDRQPIMTGNESNQTRSQAMKIARFFPFAPLVVLSMITIGCSYRPPVLYDDGRWVNVKLSEDIAATRSQTIGFATSPEELYTHALALTQEGYWSDAGDLFSDMAFIRSRDGQWEARCRAAATLCYLNAGRLEAAAKSAAATSEIEAWSRYVQPREVRVIREVGALIGRNLTTAQLDAELTHIARKNR